MGAGVSVGVVWARRRDRASTTLTKVMPLQTKKIANQREHFILPDSQRLHAKVRAKVSAALLLYRVTFYDFSGRAIAIRMMVPRSGWVEMERGLTREHGYNKPILIAYADCLCFDRSR